MISGCHQYQCLINPNCKEELILKDNNFLIYETNDAVKVEVVLENENIRLTQ